jgi:branched-chain amino acid transport system permease protein
MLEQQLINALSLGSVYALFALGFTLVFGVLGVINLSHGAIFMLGSYAALLLVEQMALPRGWPCCWPWWPRASWASSSTCWS